MKNTWYHLIRKNGWIFIAALVLLMGSKFYSVKQYVPSHTPEETAILDVWYQDIRAIHETSTGTEYIRRVDEYLDGVYDTYIRPLSAAEELTLEQEQQLSFYSRLFQSVSSQWYISYNHIYLLEYAKQGEGLLPWLQPTDFLDNLPHFAAQQEPDMISIQGTKRFLVLQEHNIVFLLAAAICLLIWGPYYESEMHLSLRTTAHGTVFERQIRWVILLTVTIFSLCSDLFDVLHSGILQNGASSLSFQSIYEFWDAPGHETIGEMLALTAFLRWNGNMLLCLITEWICRMIKDLRSASMTTGSFLLLMFFLSQGIRYTVAAAMIWIGSVDISYMLTKIRYLPLLHMTTLHLAALLSVAATIVFSVGYDIRNKYIT